MAAAGKVGSLLKLFLRSVFAVLFLIGWGLALLAVHVVVAPDGLPSEGADPAVPVDWKVVIVPKRALGVTDTYADVRGWTSGDVERHAALAGRLIEAGKGDALDHVLDATLREEFSRLGDRRSALLAAPEEE